MVVKRVLSKEAERRTKRLELLRKHRYIKQLSESCEKLQLELIRDCGHRVSVYAMDKTDDHLASPLLQELCLDCGLWNSVRLHYSDQPMMKAARRITLNDFHRKKKELDIPVLVLTVELFTKMIDQPTEDAGADSNPPSAS